MASALYKCTRKSGWRSKSLTLHALRLSLAIRIALACRLVSARSLGNAGQRSSQRLGRLLVGFALALGLGFLLPILHAETRSGVPGYAATLEKPSQSPGIPVIPAANLPASLTVLILGDSLSLCGFGESLDKKFRSDMQVKSVFTYMACGTIPVSWLKLKPFTNAKTYCGFWSIESVSGAAKAKEFQDTYGMRRGSRPKPHLVPKL